MTTRRRIKPVVKIEQRAEKLAVGLVTEISKRWMPHLPAYDGIEMARLLRDRITKFASAPIIKRKRKP